MGEHDEDRAYRRRQQRRFPQHACELPPHPDRVYPALPPDSSRWARVRRFLQKWCVGWRASKQLRAICRSTYTLESEQARQTYQKYWWVVHPYSCFFLCWQLLVIVIVLMYMALHPLHYLFFNPYSYLEVMEGQTGVPAHPFLDQNNPQTNSFKAMTNKLQNYISTPFMVCNYICYLHIIMLFLTGYYDSVQNEVVLAPSRIIKRYLKTWFVPDMMTIFRFHVARYYATTQSYREIVSENQSQYRLAWYLWFLTYQFKFVRWRFVFIYAMNWCRMANLRSTTRNVILYVLCLLSYVMWMTYLSYEVPMVFRRVTLFRNNSQSWLMDPAIGFFDVSHPNLPLRQIFLCLYRVIAVVSTHIPDFSSDTPRMTYEDHVLLLFMMWTSAALKIALLSLAVQIAGTICSAEAHLMKVHRQVRNYMREKNLPIHVRHKMMLYYSTKFNDRFFEERAIIAHLPSTVRNAVRLATSRQLVSSSALFRSVPKSLVNSIVAELHEDLYLANDVVISYGSAARHLYFLSTGTVGMYLPTGEEVAHMADGAVFGVMGLMLREHHKRQVVSVVALEVCEVFVMERRAFERLVRPLPRLYNRIRTIAMKRAEEVAPPMGLHSHDYGYGYGYGNERPVSPPTAAASTSAADSTAASPSVQTSASDN